MRVGENGSCTQDGFSLLEALVAIGVFALAVSVAMPLARGPTASAALNAECLALVHALRATRSAAISRGREASLEIDMLRRSYSSRVVPERAMDQRVSIKVTTARQAAPATASARILFFPNGQSSGARIAMTTNTGSSTISVNWATGAARLE